MKANYGYSDAAGDFFIVIDSDACDGCKRCVEVCPQSVLEMIEDDYGKTVAAVAEAVHKKLRYSCSACKPVGKQVVLPCVDSCALKAISHSW
jgi:ferredoxin